MSITKPFGKNYSYTEEELDEFGEILLTAEDIKSDEKLFRLVQQHLDEKSGKISKIKDIRDRLANSNITKSKGYVKDTEGRDSEED